MEAGLGCGSPRCRSQASPAVCQATGDRNKLIMIWDAATCKRLHIFTGHRDAVSVSWGHWARCLWGQAAVSSLASLTVCPSVPRACPSERAHTSCTALPMTAASRCGMWQRTHTWRPCKTWGNPNDPSKGCTSSREEVRGQRVTLATALCHLLLQVWTPGRHHRAGQPEPGVLCDSRGTGWHRAALEDPRGITARVFWAPVCLGCKRGLWAGMSSWGSGVWQEHPGDADALVALVP